MDLDEIDYHLLALVQVDATLPLHVLGDRIGLSPSAVQRRLTRLRTAGVIRAEVALVALVGDDSSTTLVHMNRVAANGT